MRASILIFAIAATLCAQPLKKTVLVITDAEGVAGICRQNQTETSSPELQTLLTGEANAAVDGFLAGGAEEVIVIDGHAGGSTLSAATIHPRAKLVIGGGGVPGLLERRYAALAFVGQHAMAGVRNGIMGHSFSSLGVQRMKFNGREVGEIGSYVALSGWFGTPVIFLSGDDAAVREVKELVPGIEGVSVKEGLSRNGCISASAEEARARIREGARRSVSLIGKVKPYRMEGPVTIELEYTTRYSLSPDAGRAPGATVLDDRTIRYSGKDFLEAWIRWHYR